MRSLENHTFGKIFKFLSAALATFLDKHLVTLAYLDINIVRQLKDPTDLRFKILTSKSISSKKFVIVTWTIYNTEFTYISSENRTQGFIFWMSCARRPNAEDRINSKPEDQNYWPLKLKLFILSSHEWKIFWGDFLGGLIYLSFL